MKASAAVIILFFLTTFYSCRPNGADAPVKTAREFYNALSAMDFKKASSFATKDSKTVIELLESLADMGGQVELPGETFEKMKKAEFGKAVINKNVASVPIKIGKESGSVLLKKEEGEWKVAFDKENLQGLLEKTNSEPENIPSSQGQKTM